MSVDLLTPLKTFFGHDAFRGSQREAVETIMAGRDLVMVLPTGGGKSLCYQLPAVLLSGVTVVVSPLLALMHDQVRALQAMGIGAAMLSSMQDAPAAEAIVRALRRREITLLYVAPERLVTEGFLTLLGTLPVTLFVIDEAHCVSEWGHEFRSDYRRLALLRERFPGIGIAALTATATFEVQDDISRQLGLVDPVVLRRPAVRDNLTIRCERRIGDGKRQILDFLATMEGESGIIYTISRDQTQALAAFLNRSGYTAAPYHAGLSARQRSDVYDDFIFDRTPIIVATVAFGMGIDKSNIRFVVHASFPKSIENYVQEIGRAGRDGVGAATLMLYSAADIVSRRRMIMQQEPGPYRERMIDKLRAMERFAVAQVCRHTMIAGYFGDTFAPCESRCDSCLAPPGESVDVTDDARRFLSALYRTGGRFGAGYLIDLLRGSRSQKITDNGHDVLSVYGIGGGRPKEGWSGIADRLLEIGAVELGDYRVLTMTSLGAQILKGGVAVTIRADRLAYAPRVKAKRRGIDGDDAPAGAFDRLRELRRRIAREAGVPPYVVFSDKTLVEMARMLPQTDEELREIPGVGAVKGERYGETFLKLCRQIVREP